MKKFLSMMIMAAATLALAGCGSSGSGPLTGGGKTGGGPPPPTIKTLTLTTSVPQIPSDGSQTATITALVRDASNNVVASVPISFQASSGALQVVSGTSGSDGTATATLGAAGDPTSRTITVTASAGTIQATTTVDVVGTKMTLNGPSSLVQGTSGSYTATLVNSAGTGIQGQTVTVTSKNNNTLNPATFTTDSNGSGTFQLTAANSGADTVTVSALGTQATQSLAVSSQAFSFSVPAANAQIAIGATQTVTVTWASSGTPVVGQVVNFSTTRGALSSLTATTDGSGTASVTISSTTAGPGVISASGTGASGQVNVAFIATTPSAINVQANPSTIATKAQSTITATVRDVNNNLVQGQAVNFSIVQDVTGGSLSAASAITNAQGQASVVYTASTTTSSTNGVQIAASIPSTSITGQTSLTVGGQAVFLSLGTGNTIGTPTGSTTQYSLPYSVQAIDSAGNGVAGVPISFTITSLGYIKGQRVLNGSNWATVSNTLSSDPDLYTLAGVDGCLSEDLNNNGILDPGEDYNKNGKLDPGLVASADVISGTTDSGGTASLNIIYPKDHAYYVAVRLTATATVQGTQSSTSVDFWLPGLAADFNGGANTAPPGPTSPYGQATTCINPN
ncbi:MAG TPA: Ig-like domain-containing protein [Steroidobacteraceae bacterium]|nr:Ig-like domain-containing protein [Steroidobacteraceae bacterium]